MNALRTSMIAAAGILVIAGLALATEPTTRPADRSVSATGDAALAPLARAIRNAADPQQAISAYARGYAIDPNSVVLHKACLQRMLQANLPEMAYDSARVLTTAEPGLARAWAVLAHQHVHRGEVAQAVAVLARASKALADDPFSQKVAGTVLAHYDRQAGRLALPLSQQTAIKAIRLALGNNDAFGAAYAAVAGTQAGTKPAPPTPAAAPPTTSRAEVPPPPTVEQLLSRSAPIQVAGEADALSRSLTLQSQDLARSVAGAGQYGLSPATGVYSGRSYSVVTSTGYGVPAYTTIRPYLSGYGVSVAGSYSYGNLYGSIGFGSPHLYAPYSYYEAVYPYYGYGFGYFPIYRGHIHGSITHGKPFRGIGGHSFWRSGGRIHGSITHGRPFRGLGGSSF